jgi:autotransporter translocation and assembly factor TamB
VIGVVALAALVASLLVVVQTAWFKNWLRGSAVSRTTDVLNAKLSIGSLSGSLFRGVTLDRVSLVQDGVTMFSADRIVVGYDPYVLARGRLDFQTIRVERAVVHAIENANGWNFANIAKPAKTPRTSPLALWLQRIELVDGTVTIQPRGMTPRTLTDVDGDVNLVTDAKGAQLVIRSLSADDAASGMRVQTLAGQAANNFSTFEFAFGAASTDARLSGNVKGDMASPVRRISGDVDATRIDVAPLLQDPLLVTDVTGKATFDLLWPRGAGATPSVGFTFAGPFARAFDYEASDVRADGTWADGRLQVVSSSLAYGARVSAKTDWIVASGDRVAKLSTSGRFTGLDLRRVPKTLPAPPLASSLAGQFDVRMLGSSWTADATLAPSTIEGAAIASGFIAHVEGRGSDLRYTAGGRVANLDVSRLAGPLKLPLLSEARYQGRMNGDIYALGRERESDAKNRVLVAGVDLRDSIVGGAVIERMRAAVTLAGTRLAIDVHGGFDKVGRVVLGLPESIDASLNGVIDASILLPDISADLDVNTIAAAGRVSLASSTIQDVAITTGVVEASVDRGVATVAELMLDGPEARATGKGTFAFGAQGESAFDLVADANDLALLAKRFDVDATGLVHLEARITGPASKLTATGLLNGHSLAYGDTASALTLNTTFSADVVDQRFADAKVDAKSEATFVTIGGMEVLRLTATTGYQSRLLDLDARIEQAERSVDLTGAVVLQPELQEVRLRRLAVTTAGTEWNLPEGGEATIRYAKGSIDVAGLTLQNGAQQIDARGGVATTAEAVAATQPLALQIRNVQVADLNRMLLGTKKIEGLLNGTAELRGLVTNPEVTSNIAVTNGVVEGTKFQSFAGKIDVRDRVATIDVRLDESATNALTARGTVPLPGEPAPAAGLDVQVTSAAIDLGLLQAFTEEVQKISGTGQVDVRVTGTLAAPRANGTVALDKGQFSLASTGLTYTGLKAQVRVEDNKLFIDEWQMADDDGHRVFVTGGLDVANAEARSVDLRISTTDFHILRNALGNVEMDAALKVSGDLNAPRVEGIIRLQQGRLEVDEILERTTKNPYRTSTDTTVPTATRPAGADTAVVTTPDLPGAPKPVAKPPAPTGSLFDNTTIDLTLDLPDNLVLRGRDMRVASASLGLGDMNMTVGGELTLQKASGSSGIVVIGALEVVRGYYDFQGRRFDVARGSGVRFRGEQPIDPALSITAEREISGVTAKVQVNGRVSEPQIALSSTPPLDEGDILSLIVFNTPINQLGESERVSLAERAGTLAAGVIASPIANSVARALNLDQFEIQAAGQNGSGPSVELGSQIGTRIFLGLRQEFGRDERSTVSFEYRFTDFLRLVSSVAQGPAGRSATSRRAGTSAADLIFVIRY